MRLYCLKRDRGVEQWRHEQPRRQGLRRAARGSRSRVAVSHVVGGVVRRRHAQPEARRDELRGVGQRHSSCSDSAPEGGAARASSVTTQCGRAAACRAERPLQPAVAEDGDALLARVRAARRWPRAMSIWSGTASASSGLTHTSASRGAKARRGEPRWAAARLAAARPQLAEQPGLPWP